MKRIIKSTNSRILEENLRYLKGNSINNALIREILIEEQKGFCAYTESRIKSTDAIDIEHFNENLKYTPEDNYENWYAVEHKWNNKYKKPYCLPIINPHDDDVESRIWYDIPTGIYMYDSEDIAAKNLVDIIGLNDGNLPKARIDHIQLIIVLFNESGLNEINEWLKYPECKQQLIEFRRAMETAFNIDLSTVF